MTARLPCDSLPPIPSAQNFFHRRARLGMSVTWRGSHWAKSERRIMKENDLSTSRVRLVRAIAVGEFDEHDVTDEQDDHCRQPLQPMRRGA